MGKNNLLIHMGKVKNTREVSRRREAFKPPEEPADGVVPCT